MSHVEIRCPARLSARNVPGRSPFAGERTSKKFGELFFLFFPCNPLKVHETTKEKLGDSKEIFGGSKKILGKKKKKLGGAGDFERAPAALFVSRAARAANPPWRNPRGRRPRLR
jgi:hypothetical protein